MDFRLAEKLIAQRFQLRDRIQNDEIVDFLPNPAQHRFFALCQRLEEEKRRKRIISVKARRIGFSRAVEAIACCYMFTYANFEGRVMAHFDETAADIMSSAALMCYGDGMPGKGLPWRGRHAAWDPDTDYKTVVVPHLGRKGSAASRLLRASAKVRGKGRGLGFSFVHCSEAAYYPAESPFTAVLPALAKSVERSFAVLESTGNGQIGDGEAFYNYWQQASDPDKHGDSEWVRFFVPWTEDPYCVTNQIPKDIPRDDEEKVLLKAGLSKAQIAWRRIEIATTYQGIVEDFAVENPLCLVGDTLVSTQRGIVRLQSVSEGDETESGQITDFAPQGVKEVFKARTKFGRILVGTHDHPLERPDGTFVNLKQATGESINLRAPRFATERFVLKWALPFGIETALPITEDIALFLGIFLGDGCYTANQIDIACDAQDADVIGLVTKLMHQFFGNATHKYGPGKCVHVRVGTVAFADIMKQLGIWKEYPPHRKLVVPDAILQSPRPVVRAFLRGLFEADGFAGWGQPRVSIFSKEVDFLRQIQLLLLGFGISAKVTSRVAIARFKGKPPHPYTANTLDLLAQESESFMQEIGFISARKTRTLPKIKSGRPRQPRGFVDQVIEVDPAGQLPVFDLTIGEKHHTFSANGIVVHNCPDDAFIAGGFPAFAHEEREYVNSTVRPPILTAELERTRDPLVVRLAAMGTRGRIKIWELPQPRMEYYLGADLARGQDMKAENAIPGDFAAITVFNGSTGQQAAAFSDRIDPSKMAEIVDLLGRFYRTPEIGAQHCAMLNIEMNANLGAECQRLLRDKYAYPIWRFARWRGGKDDRYHRKPGTAIGWETTTASRNLMFAAFRNSLREKQVVVRDAELAQQICSSTMNDGRWEVVRGHDDVLVSGLLSWITRQQFPPRTILPAQDVPAEPRRIAEFDIGKVFPLVEALARTDGNEMNTLLNRRRQRDPLQGVLDAGKTLG